MPELPEVETTINGIRPYLENQIIRRLVIRQRRLRWPIIAGLENIVGGRTVVKLERRGKYILIHFEQGGLIIHLGMSGSIRVLLESQTADKHDHFDIVTGRNSVIRFRDPRKFGSLLYSSHSLSNHPRIRSLGVEPLSEEFTADLLHKMAKARSVPIKTLIMDGRVVVGVGNIYASEALFAAGIHPMRKCSRIAFKRYEALIIAIQKILCEAIAKGGTTLKDFTSTDGQPGYFEQNLAVYGKEGMGCKRCGNPIRNQKIAQRSTFYCAKCQR